MKKSLLICAMLGLCSAPGWATVIIDDFGTVSGTDSFSACSGAGATTGSNTGTSNIGGGNARQVSVEVTALLNTGGGCSSVTTTSPTVNQVLTFANAFGTFGRAQVLWNPTGTVDLADQAILRLDIGIDGGISPNDTNSFSMLFCSDSATCTETGGSNLYRIDWSITGQVAPIQTYSFNLSSAVANGSVNWNSIDAIRMVINSGNSSDLVIDQIRLDSVPEPSTFALLGGSLAAFAMFRRRSRA